MASGQGWPDALRNPSGGNADQLERGRPHLSVVRVAHSRGVRRPPRFLGRRCERPRSDRAVTLGRTHRRVLVYVHGRVEHELGPRGTAGLSESSRRRDAGGRYRGGRVLGACRRIRDTRAISASGYRGRLRESRRAGHRVGVADLSRGASHRHRRRVDSGSPPTARFRTRYELRRPQWDERRRDRRTARAPNSHRRASRTKE